MKLLHTAHGGRKTDLITCLVTNNLHRPEQSGFAFDAPVGHAATNDS